MNPSLRVLFVEDNDDDAQLEARVLERAGYAVTWERVDSPTALDVAVSRQPWDIVLSDNSMPLFSGGGAIAALRSLGVDIPIVVVTGSLGDEAAVDLVKTGAHDYVLKDNLARLVPAVERALRDATARREAREAVEALRASEEQFRTVFEHSAEAILILDARDGRIVQANDTASHSLGRPKAELLGTMLGEFLTDPSGAEPGAAALAGARLVAREVRRHDGRVVPVEVSASAIPWRQEPALLLELRDVSERKRAEEAVRRAEEQARNAQRMESVGRLAGGIAHDFNNLLGVILGHAEMLLRRLPDDAPARRGLEQIKRAATGAAGLTRQLLAFSRRQVLRPQVVDLNRLVAEVERMVRRVIGEDIDLDSVTAPDLGRVRADPAQMEQVMMNLVVNARDAMPRGGRLTIETRNVEVTPDDAAVAAGPYVLLAVSDTGEGMAPEVQANIFEPFFTTKPEGTGLGLATVYGIVSQSSGHIAVDSAPGRGTTFRILLPRVADVGEDPDLAPGPAHEAAGQEVVLLVEDQEMVRNMTQEILEALGYTVIAADSGEAAMALAASHAGPIHLLLSDVVMRGMSGPELARAIQTPRPGLPVVFMSGYAEGVNGSAALDGTAAFLSKPFTVDALAKKLREVLDRRARG